MAKPIEATPVLKGQDLISLVSSLKNKDSVASKQKRMSALRMLKKATNR